MRISRLAYNLGLELQGLKDKKILIAFSGGLDSCVLLELLSELKVRLNLELAVAHIHHGDLVTEPQKNYRNQALEFSKKRALESNAHFFYEKYAPLSDGVNALKISQSEASLRKIRLTLLEKIRTENKYDVVAFAHHAQDLFETRLIRLIRGTGQNGLEAMRLHCGIRWRPLLKIWPEQMMTYATQKKIQYLTDPSNGDFAYLRNWIRGSWLLSLETKRPGSTQAFARSLELLAESQAEIEGVQSNKATLDRESFKSLSKSKQTRVLAACLRGFEKQNYSSNMILEICKRLDTPRKQLKFDVAGFEWTANAKQIFVREI